MFLYFYGINPHDIVRAGKIFLLSLLLILCGRTYSQIDKEFWFVGPEASANHGDRPVYIRVSTMDAPAHVTLRMPANLTFNPILNNVPANTTISMRIDNIGGDLTWIDSIENRPPNEILRKGFLLTSDEYVTAYYEINNASNPAIFPFKGKNGLGTEFYIPGQTDYINHVNNGSEAFDIIATQDTTLITITPSVDIVGHDANIPFQIILHRGQTWSARTMNTTASVSLAGSHVTSDKPIAITISDDSIVTGGWDIIGDQLVPVNLLGWEYIAIKGFANNVVPSDNDERAYVLATQDNTEIRVDGNPVPVAILNAGQQFDYGIPDVTNTAYIRASKPVYVYHLTGHPGEAGSSILPQDSCTGSRKIGFNRSSSSAFALLILTRDGNQSSFLLNSDPSIITPAGFQPVPGTGGNYVYFRQNNMTTTQVPVGANLIENTSGKFHLGVLNNVGASSEYGYFSDFSTLYLGADANMCMGDSVVLDGGPFRNSYEWKRLVAGSWITVGSNQTYICYDTGFYACQTDGDFCTLMDTIHVQYYPDATVTLGSDRTICEGVLTTFTPGSYVSYLWSTGTTTPSLTTGDAGEVWVRVTNNVGCVAYDTVMVILDSLPQASHPVLGPSTVCQGQEGVVYAVDSLKFATSYAWVLPPGATGSSVTKEITAGFSASSLSGNVSVHGINACGTGPEVLLPVTVDPLPGDAGIVSGPSTVCQGQSGMVYSVAPVLYATSYEWQLPPGFTILSGAGSESITVSASLSAAPGMITVFGSNYCGTGAMSTFSVSVNLFPQPAGPVFGDDVVCQGETDVVYSVTDIAGADTYVWGLPSGATVTSGIGTSSITVTFDSSSVSGNISVFGQSALCGDGIPSLLPVTVNPLPSPAGLITGPAEVCQGASGVAFSISPVANATSYEWSLPPGALILSGAATSTLTLGFNTTAASGLITVKGYNALCGFGRQRSHALTVNPLPLATGAILGSDTLCEGTPGVAYGVTVVDPLTTDYQWVLTPSGAGSIHGNGSAITIDWAEGYQGQAHIRVNGHNGCGSGPVSPLLSVTLHYKPVVSFSSCFELSTTKNARPVILRGGSPLGPGSSYTGTAVALDGSGQWTFNPGDASVTGATGGTPYTLTYRYTNIYSCFREASQVIRVYPSNAGSLCPGTLTDVRDGTVYPVFSAGSGVTARCWMAANLNYGVFISSDGTQTENCSIEKYCDGNNQTNCGYSGGYYQWQELMNYQTVEGGQGICPPGWHVPTRQEWEWLQAVYLGPGIAGGALKDLSVVQGFHGLLSGMLYQNHQWAYTVGANTGAMFWTSTMTGSGKPLVFGLNAINPSVSEYPSNKGNAFQVRCVKD